MSTIPLDSVWCPFCKVQRHAPDGRIGAHTLEQEVRALDKTGKLRTATVSVVCPGVNAMIIEVK